MLSQLFSRLKRKKKEEVKVSGWGEKIEAEDAKSEGIRLQSFSAKTLAFLREITPTISLPRFRYTRILSKIKRLCAFSFSILFFFMGIFALFSPISSIMFITSMLLMDEFWNTRKEKWIVNDKKDKVND